MRPVISFPIAAVEAAAPLRPPGYLEAVLSTGKRIADQIQFTHDEWESLRARFGGGMGDLSGAGPGGCRGCGD